jgi:hypothetical protein
MLLDLRDWWQNGINDIGVPRLDTVSHIPEAISLIEAEKITRNREPGDGSQQRDLIEQINAALAMVEGAMRGRALVEAGRERHSSTARHYCRRADLHDLCRQIPEHMLYYFPEQVCCCSGIHVRSNRGATGESHGAEVSNRQGWTPHLPAGWVFRQGGGGFRRLVYLVGDLYWLLGPSVLKKGYVNNHLSRLVRANLHG